MTRYCFDTEPVADFPALCSRMAGHPLQSPYRSTVPLLSLVEHGQPAWHSLLAHLEAPPDAAIHFEYCVPLPKAGGNPSQTDARRIRKPEADGADPRKTVAGWLHYLQPYASHELHVDDFGDAVYQTIHRAASACAVATEKRLRPELVYLHFHPSPLKSSATTDQYVSDLRYLRSLLGSTSDLRMTVVEMPLEPTAAFLAIQNLNKRARETADAVAETLCRGPLFEFGSPVLTAVQ